MTSLYEACVQYAADNPKRYGASWNGWCGALMARLCTAWGKSAEGDVSTAWRAWLNSPTGGTNPTKAPVGAFHFWAWDEPGHVGLDTSGGGRDVFMASSLLRDSLGDAIGFQSVAGYNAANRSARYVGWTTTYSGGYIDLTSFAGGGATPIGDDMPTVNDLLKAAVPRQDGQGSTSLEGILATWDERFNTLPGRILDEAVTRGGDIPDSLKQTPGSLRGVVAYYDANNLAILRAIASIGAASGLTAEQISQVVRDALKGSALDNSAVEAAVKAALDGATITLRK